MCEGLLVQRQFIMIPIFHVLQCRFVWRLVIHRPKSEYIIVMDPSSCVLRRNIIMQEIYSWFLHIYSLNTALYETTLNRILAKMHVFCMTPFSILTSFWKFYFCCRTILKTKGNFTTEMLNFRKKILKNLLRSHKRDEAKTLHNALCYYPLHI